MALQNHSATARIFKELTESETEIDKALAKSASLLATMAQARIDTASPISTGQTAIMRLVRSLSSLTDARADMIRTHADLLKIGKERGDFSLDPNGCPSASIETKATPGLKLVG